MTQLHRTKTYKHRFRVWGWRKNIKLDPGRETGVVQDLIKAGDARAQEVILANGQLVDIGRLHQHLRRKRLYKETPVTIRINQPDDYYNSEEIFYSIRLHTLGRYQGKLNRVTDPLDLIGSDELRPSRWHKFTDETKELMQRQNLDELIVHMRRAPDEVANLVQVEPTVLYVMLLMYIIKLCDQDTLAHAQPRQFRLVVKSLFNYAASLLLSRREGMHTSHPLYKIVKGLATAPDGDLSEIASRGYQVTLHAWVEIVLLDSPSVVSKGDQGEKDEGWFHGFIEAMVNKTIAEREAKYGKRHIRCIEALQSKTELLIYTNTANRIDSHLDPRLQELYLQILVRGAQGSSRADALKFLAASHRARGELDAAEDYERLLHAPMDSEWEEPSHVLLEEEMPGDLPCK